MSKDKKTPAKKPVKKPTKKSSLTCSVDVPRGGQIIHHFVLTPKLPKDGKARDWELADAETGKEVSLVEVGFCEESNAVEQVFERAILLVDMAQDKQGSWCFVDNGAIPCEGSEDYLDAITTEIANSGKTLVVYIQLDQLGKETVNFSYVASFNDNDSGEIRVYRSADPGIVVGRPVRP